MTQEDQKTLISAAVYVRMSTGHQEYSIYNQFQEIKRYASKHGYKIIKIFKDREKSGLQVKGRKGFQELMEQVQKGESLFSAILVYDASRWGRFQNSDEAMYYVYCCRRAGVKVIFCADPLGDEEGLIANFVKAINHANAGHLSENLSNKVFHGQANLIRRGCRQGGPAGFGLRRQLVDSQKIPKGILSLGEHKSIQTDRVILVKGPQEEVEIVKFIYDSFVNHSLGEQAIANQLNQRKIRTDRNREWTRGVVHQILINEKYIGNNVWNRRSFKLKEERIKNPKEEWIRADDVFEPVISKELFNKAQAIIVARSYRLTNDEMLDKLRVLYQKKGRLSGIIIDEDESCPSSSTYRNRFGSLPRSYQLIGYQSDRDLQYIEVNKLLRQRYPEIVNQVIENIKSLGGTIHIDEETGLLIINEEFTASLVLSRCQQTKAGNNRWVIRLDTGLSPDISIIVRMCLLGKEIIDYYLLPSSYLDTPKFRLIENQVNILDSFRFNSLDQFYVMAKRLKLKDFTL